ncbi:LuxR C-terminal-related transcriptional regulator [Streptomyces sp. NPDC002537]
MGDIDVRIYADDPILQAGTITQLQQCPGIRIVPDGHGPGEVALVVAEALDDISIKLLRQLHQSPPDRTALLISHIDNKDLPLAAACGVLALLPRRLATVERLTAIISAAARGEGAMPGDLLRHLLAQVEQLHQYAAGHNETAPGSLTDREQRILSLAAEGCSTTDIARGIGYSERTVTSMFGSLIARLGVRNRTQAVAYAVRHDLI